MRKLIRPIFIGILFVVSGYPTAQAVILSDRIFNTSAWTTQIIQRGPDGTYDGSATQVLSGGNTDEYLQVFAARDPDTPGLDNSTGVWSFCNTTYDPSVFGAIDTVDMSLDAIQYQGGSGGGLNVALMQGGIIYRSAFAGVSIPETSWTSHSFMGLTQSSFRDPDDISSMPDFSSSGGPISFGWLYAVSSATANPVSRTVGFDNWIATITPVSETTTFTDVPSNHWAYYFIGTLAASGITKGCNATHYCPNDPVTRAQMAVFLERGMRGGDYQPDTGVGNVFLDVPASYWAGGWIELLSMDGITTGCGPNIYCPDDSVTREQMAVFLLRAKHGQDYVPPTPIGIFNDVGLNHWAAPWIEQLANEGITIGCGPDIYCPKDAVTRAQMAVFLVRTFYLQSQRCGGLGTNIQKN